jgi:general secretion pathway protein D
LRDLDIIEGALAALNVTPPLVNIEAKFAEISQTDQRGLGFDWFLGNTLISNGKMGFQGGTAPSFSDSSSPGNPYGVFPGSGGIATRAPDPETDNLITGGLTRNPSLPAIGTFTGILTEPQFRAVIRAMEARENVDLLSAPKVTTVSGRQARISVEDTQTIITGLNVQGLGGGGAGVVGGGFGGGVGVPGGFTAPPVP